MHIDNVRKQKILCTLELLFNWYFAILLLLLFDLKHAIQNTAITPTTMHAVKVIVITPTKNLNTRNL
jgi:hypothetical protein